MPSIETTGDPNKYFVVSADCHAKRSGRVRKMRPIWMLILLLSFAACGDAGSGAGSSDAPNLDATGDEGPRILEFYYGLDMLPPHTIITIGPRRSMSSPPGKSAMSDRSYLRRRGRLSARPKPERRKMSSHGGQRSTTRRLYQ